MRLSTGIVLLLLLMTACSGPPPSRPTPRLAESPHSDEHPIWQPNVVPTPRADNDVTRTAGVEQWWPSFVEQSFLSPGGDLVLLADRTAIHLVRPADGVIVGRLEGISADVVDVSFSSNGEQLGVLTSDSGWTVYDLIHLERLFTWQPPESMGCEGGSCVTKVVVRDHAIAWAVGSHLVVANTDERTVTTRRLEREGEGLWVREVQLAGQAERLLVLTDHQTTPLGIVLREDSLETVAELELGCPEPKLLASGDHLLFRDCPGETTLVTRLDGTGAMHVPTARDGGAIAIAPTGSRFAFIAPSRSVHVWHDGRTSPPLAEQVARIAIGHTEDALVVLTEQGEVLLVSEARRETLGFAPGTLALSRDEGLAIVADGQALHLFDLHGGPSRTIQRPQQDVEPLIAAARPGRFTLLGGRYHPAWYSSASPGWQMDASETAPSRPQWLGGGLALFSCAGPKLWSEDLGPLPLELPDAQSVVASHDGRFVAFVGLDTTEVWSVADRAVVATFPNPSDAQHAAAFSPDDAWLIVVEQTPMGAPGRGRPVRVVRTSDWSLVHTFTPQHEARSISFLPNGELVTGEGVGAMFNLSYWVGDELERFDLATGARRGTLPGAFMSTSPEGTYAVAHIGHPFRSATVESHVYETTRLTRIAVVPGQIEGWAGEQVAIVAGYATMSSNAAPTTRARTLYELPSGKRVEPTHAFSLTEALSRRVRPEGLPAGMFLPRMNPVSTDPVEGSFFIPHGADVAGRTRNGEALVLTTHRNRVRFIDLASGRFAELGATEGPDGDCRFYAIDDRGRFEGDVPIIVRQGHNAFHAPIERDPAKIESWRRPALLSHPLRAAP